MRRLRLLALLLPLLSAAARSGESVDEALRSMAKEAAAPNGGRTPRLAVMAILPASGEDNRYGQWLSEALASEVRKQGRFRLYERSRLDAVAKEHALALSGALGAEEAKKVGELVPVDFLLSGTWTRLGEEVEANLRLLDVVSGEVALALRRRIPLDEAHRGLVTPLPAAVAKTAPRDSGACSEWTDSVRTRLSDAAGEDAVRRLEDALVRLPFGAWDKCARGHWNAMDLLAKARVPVPRYRAFLLSTLDSVAIPSEDDRGAAIVDFLAATGGVSAGEWETVERAATRCRPLRMGYFVNGLVGPEPADAALQRRRVDRLMALAREGKMGRPLPGTVEEVFLTLLPQLASRKGTPSEPEDWWLWKGWISRLKVDGEDAPEARRLRQAGAALFRRDLPEGGRKELGDWLCARWSRLQDDRTLAEEVERHWNWLEEKPALQAEFEREGKACAETFARAGKANPYVNQVLRMRKVALRHGFVLPGFLPEVKELSDSIRSADWRTYAPAAELLIAYGAKARPALPAVTRQLRRTKGQGSANVWRFRGDLARVVGNCGAGDSAAIAEVVGMLATGMDEPVDSAIQALGDLGKAALPAMQARWTGLEDYRKVYLVRAMARMPRAVQPLAWLRQRRAEPGHESLMRAIDDVLDP